MLLCFLGQGLRAASAGSGARHEPGAFVLLPLPSPPNSGPGFILLSARETGIDFTNRLSEWATADNRILNNGCGVAAGDYDQDGRIDLLFTSLDASPRLFRNLGGWKFKDTTEESGLGLPSAYYRGTVFADLNGDSWPDLLIGSQSRGVLCFYNDKAGHFAEATRMSGISNPQGSSTFSLADVDGNGTLDLYIANYRQDDIRDWPRVPVQFVNGQPTLPPQLRDRLSFKDRQLTESGQVDQLFLNDGTGRFTAVSWTDGRFLDEEGKPLKAPPTDWGLTASFRDLNRDGAPDLYICNDYWTPDRIWINLGDGRFKAAAPLAFRKTPASSMGVDFSDLNRDGFLDLFVVDMRSRRPELRKRQAPGGRPTPTVLGQVANRPQINQNALFLNRGDDTYTEISQLAGLHATEWSWSPVFLDVDLDGYDDLLITTGHIRDIQDLDANLKVQSLQASWRRNASGVDPKREFIEAKMQHNRLYPPLQSPILSFRNKGNLTFEETTAAWGFGSSGVHHGMALADLDGDGDLDVAVNCLGAGAKVFRNKASGPRIAVRLHGRAPNTAAIGAQVELLNGMVSNQQHEITCGGTYLSGSDTCRVFAPGQATNALLLRVRWRDGTLDDLPSVMPNQIVDIWQDRPALRPVGETRPSHPSTAVTVGSASPPLGPPWFSDRSEILLHRHLEDIADDFSLQPLLPRSLSQPGPGIAWFDWNDDGWDDLLIASGAGEPPIILVNQRGASFTRLNLPLPPQLKAQDQAGLLGMRSFGIVSLLAAMSDGSPGRREAPSVGLVKASAPQTLTTLPGVGCATGALALGDLDGNGELDLLVAGQFVPGRYPSPASSSIYRGKSGTWQLDESNSRLLKDLGLVQGALWTDLTGDGYPELVLACEWGPIRVFLNTAGTLSEVTKAWGFSDWTGLWMGVASVDLNGDGRMDLVAGNWGLNTPLQPTEASSVSLYYGDLAGRGQTEILEVENDPITHRAIPSVGRHLLDASLPFLRERFPSHLSFSQAGLSDVIAGLPQAPKSVSVRTVASACFLNHGTRFERRELPKEAQLSPCLGVTTADFNGDGFEDVFVGQNYFAFRWEEQRLDGGRGQLLLGDGNGALNPISGGESGIQVYGEARGVATADYDHDGRPDLVVTQNSGPTRLFQNLRGKPCLSVQLDGPPGNPSGIGSILRLRYPGQRQGPAHEIRCGGGYLSQDSGTALLGMAGTPIELQVVWPGGKVKSIPLSGTERLIRAKYRE